MLLTALTLVWGICAGCGDGTFDIDAGDQAPLGAAYVAQRHCGQCHRAPDGTLSGQTTPQPGTTTYGSNLTPDIATGIGGWADIQIIRAMRFGVDPNLEPLCPPMMHYTDMSDPEARAIVAYLRSLAPVARTIPASLCPPLKPAPPVDMAVPPGDMAVPTGDAAVPPADLALPDGGLE